MIARKYDRGANDLDFRMKDSGLEFEIFEECRKGNEG